MKFKMPCCGGIKEVRLCVHSYDLYGNLAIETRIRTGPFRWETADMLTVNISPRGNADYALIDTNKLGGNILAWLEETHLAIPTDREEQSGFCIYPECHFNPELLMNVDPKGYARHIRQWNERRALEKLRTAALDSMSLFQKGTVVKP